jgi:hypothetical protein
MVILTLPKGLNIDISPALLPDVGSETVTKLGNAPLDGVKFRFDAIGLATPLG